MSAREVANTLDDSVNLAAMDWEEFEHLIRELFEQEFAVGGGEVKVTQASRDGGVDAIAFDPDPIRGGKIVIQAKRYTNTVGVAAVRDLYGTLMNEGANRGILDDLRLRARCVLVCKGETDQSAQWSQSPTSFGQARPKGKDRYRRSPSSLAIETS